MQRKSSELLLSVVVPVTRMSGKLENLKSWLLQLPPSGVEIWIIHDIQDEFTSHELRELILSINNRDLHLVEGVYLAPGLARNVGIEKSSARWLAFWDSDDLPHVGNVMTLLKDFQGNSEVIIGSYKKISKSLQSRNRIISHRNVFEVAEEPSLWRMLFKREVVGKTRFTDLRMAEDQIFLSEICFASKINFYSKTIFYEYFMNVEGQLTKNKEAIVDLSKAIHKLGFQLKFLSGLDFEFTSALLSNQIWSSFKRGTILWRWRIFLNVFANFKRLDLRQRLSFVNTLFRSVFLKMKAGLYG